MGLVLARFYMAPELASGSRNAPPTTDIFSLGVIAFELLTEKLPFSMPPVMTIWHKRDVVVPRLLEQRPELPETFAALAALIDRCLARDPAVRPALQEVLNAIPGQA